MSDEPLVSCIMATRDRRAFVAQSVRYFLRQSYANRELVIVDDGYDQVDDLVRGDERLRHVRAEPGTTLGAKRNLACELARGELIAHWDDDDWVGPARLEAQVQSLTSSGATATAAGELLHYRLEVGDAWLYRAPPGSNASLAGGTLLYRRSAWLDAPFPPTGLGEHRGFLSALPKDRVLPAPAPDFYVAVIHGKNASNASVEPPAWERRPFSEVESRLALDTAFYAGLRNGGSVPAPFRAKPSSAVTVATNFMVWDGYGSMAEYLVVGLAREGAEVRVAPFGIDPMGLTDEFLRLLENDAGDAAGPVIWFAPPPGAHERFPRASDIFVNTMWEASRLPSGWLPAIQRARALIVPTRFVADVARRQGVTVPIAVIPEGVDPDVYPLIERPEREGLTTLMVGPTVRRKHVDEGVAAWQQAFADDPTARLILKSKFGMRNHRVEDPRIRLVDDTEASRGILHWYREADVLLALGNEGFGLPLVEGMATGLPVIALDSEGQADVCADARSLLLPVPPRRFEPCDDTAWGLAGSRGVPGVDDVAAQLRWVDGNREAAREIGREASRWARTHRNIWRKPPAVLDLIERSLVRPRPLRRKRLLYSPGRGSRAARTLARRAPRTRLVREAPALDGARLVHCFDSGEARQDELSRVVLEARLSGVPVAVTVAPRRSRISAYERDANALVATSEATAAALRERLPDKRIVVVPSPAQDSDAFVRRHLSLWAELEAS